MKKITYLVRIIGIMNNALISFIRNYFLMLCIGLVCGLIIGGVLKYIKGNIVWYFLLFLLVLSIPGLFFLLLKTKKDENRKNKEKLGNTGFHKDSKIQKDPKIQSVKEIQNIKETKEKQQIIEIQEKQEKQQNKAKDLLKQLKMIKEQIKKEYKIRIKDDIDTKMSRLFPGIIFSITVELGMNLYLLNEKKGNILAKGISRLRYYLIEEFGVVFPGVEIKDNYTDYGFMNTYVIKIGRVKVAQQTLRLDKFLAVGPEEVLKKMTGDSTTDPISGLPALWIDEQLVSKAEELGCEVSEPLEIIVYHLTKIIGENICFLCDRITNFSLIDELKRDCSIPELDFISIRYFHKVLQELWRDNFYFSFSEYAELCEYLSEALRYTKDVDVLIEYIRRKISHKYLEKETKNGKIIYLSQIDFTLEELIIKNLKKTAFGYFVNLDYNSRTKILSVVKERVDSVINDAKNNNYENYLFIIMTSPVVRKYFRSIIEKDFPDICVFSFSEVSMEVIKNAKSIQTISI